VMAHNDLSPANILLADDGSVKLADVGLGVRLRDTAERAPPAYSLSTFRQYGVEVDMQGRAPEVRAGGRLTPAVDVWSLACVFFFVLTNGARVNPFVGANPAEVDASIRAGRFQLSELMTLRGPPRAALEARHLLASMLAPLPASRPTAAKVLAHPLFWTADVALAAAKDLYDTGADTEAALSAAMGDAMLESAAGGGSAASERGALLAAAACDVADWQARVHGPLLARLRAYASAEGYADGFGGLLRFARNASEHPPAGAELTPLLAALQEAGFTDPAPRRPRSVAARRSLLADYILCLFPALSIAVYECGGGAPSVK